MNIAILTFDGFNELDSFIALGILNRMKGAGWNVQITCPTEKVTSMNGVTIDAQQDLSFCDDADIVLFGSGIYTREVAKNDSIMSQINLDTSRQIVGAQCSGTLLMAELDLLNGLPACTDLTTKPWVIEAGVEVLNQPFMARDNVATAGGCMASQYLATWAISKGSSIEDAAAAIDYVGPVGEKESYTKQCLDIVSPYLG
ncbi:MAG: transcriptional regulator GlxA family with amidase domain [Cocleimonas sp.]|jgi:transcriptional regulator GlxA family with amidase domain